MSEITTIQLRFSVKYMLLEFIEKIGFTKAISDLYVPTLNISYWKGDPADFNLDDNQYQKITNNDQITVNQNKLLFLRVDITDKGFGFKNATIYYNDSKVLIHKNLFSSKESFYFFTFHSGQKYKFKENIFTYITPLNVSTLVKNRLYSFIACDKANNSIVLSIDFIPTTLETTAPSILLMMLFVALTTTLVIKTYKQWLKKR